MNTYRSLTGGLHHFLVQHGPFKPFVSVNDAQTLKGKKYSYISEFNPNNERMDALYKTIKQHINIFDHVYVNFGEPGIMWKDINDPAYPDGNYFSTIDFINRFSKDDPVDFFANLVSSIPTNRPLHYVNDMFFQGNDIYKKYDICKDLFKELNYELGNRTYFWESMFSRHFKFYKYFKTHPADKVTLSTCWPLGVEFYSKNVRKPNITPAEDIGIDNLRCSDLFDPEIYNLSYYSMVFETVRHNHFAMFSEKEAKPIITKRPFIIFGSYRHLEAFRSLGFKTFSPVIDESYDLEIDEDKRFQKVCESMVKLSKQDPVVVYKELEPILEHNKKHFENKDVWNKEFLKAWYQNSVVEANGNVKVIQ